jgi:hypothetical protein
VRSVLLVTPADAREPDSALVIRPLARFDESFFTRRELGEMRRLARMYRDAAADAVREAPHLPGRPWHQTYEVEGRRGALISYALALDGGPGSVTEELAREIEAEDRWLAELARSPGSERELRGATGLLLVPKIVSGGQTGGDRGGLDAALELHLDRGGWAPRGWRAEDGVIPERYRAGMREAPTADWNTRTAYNVRDSGGTVVFSFAPRLTGGSRFTAAEAARQGRPLRHVVLPARGSRSPGDGELGEAERAALLAWIDEHQIRVLNVAGPRESKAPGIQRAVRDAVVFLLENRVPARASEVERVTSGRASSCEPTRRSGDQARAADPLGAEGPSLLEHEARLAQLVELTEEFGG